MDSNNCSDEASKVNADCENVKVPKFKGFSFFVSDNKPKTKEEMNLIRLEGKFVIALAVLQEHGIKLKFTEDVMDMSPDVAELLGGPGKRHTIKTTY